MYLKPDHNKGEKIQTVNGNGRFSKKYGSGTPLTHTSPKSPLQGLCEYTAHSLSTGHSVDTNEATMSPTPENLPCWHNWHRPREIFLGYGMQMGQKKGMSIFCFPCM